MEPSTNSFIYWHSQIKIHAYNPYTNMQLQMIRHLHEPLFMQQKCFSRQASIIHFEIQILMPYWYCTVILNNIHLPDCNDGTCIIHTDVISGAVTKQQGMFAIKWLRLIIHSVECVAIYSILNILQNYVCLSVCACVCVWLRACTLI